MWHPLVRSKSVDILILSNFLIESNCQWTRTAFNRLRIASEGAIPILVDYIKDPENDIIGRQYCAMALGNLAAEPENHVEIVKSEGVFSTIAFSFQRKKLHCLYLSLQCDCAGVDALISLLKTEDIEGGRYAAFGLANLAANANYREKVVEEGAVPALISLACCEDINAQRQALTALRSLCISPVS